MSELETFCFKKKKEEITLEDCDYFFKKVITEKKKIDIKYLYLFTQAFLNILSRNFDFKVRFKVQTMKFFQELFENSNCLAVYSLRKNEIILREDVFKNIAYKPVKFFTSLLHEFYHAYQENCYRHNQFSYDNYRYTQERLLSEKDEYYYKSNYSFLTIEKEAERFASSITKIYLLKILYDIKKVSKNFLPPNYCESLSNYNDIGNKEKLDVLFASYFKKNCYLLMRYPLFRYEYDLSGHRRSSIDILNILEKEKDPKKVTFLKELLIKREYSLYHLVLDYIELIADREKFKDREFVDLLILKYIYFKLERELTLVSLEVSLPIIRNIIFKLVLPRDNDLKYLLDNLYFRLTEQVKYNRKVRFKI